MFILPSYKVYFSSCLFFKWFFRSVVSISLMFPDLENRSHVRKTEARASEREINGETKAVQIHGWALSLPNPSPRLPSPSLCPFRHRTRIRVRIRIRTLRGRYGLRKLRRRRSRHLLELGSSRHRFHCKAFRSLDLRPFQGFRHRLNSPHSFFLKSWIRASLFWVCMISMLWSLGRQIDTLTMKD